MPIAEAGRQTKVRRNSRRGCGNCKLRKVKVPFLLNGLRLKHRLSTIGSAMRLDQNAADVQPSACSAITMADTMIWSYQPMGLIILEASLNRPHGFKSMLARSSHP